MTFVNTSSNLDMRMKLWGVLQMSAEWKIQIFLAFNLSIYQFGTFHLKVKFFFFQKVKRNVFGKFSLNFAWWTLSLVWHLLQTMFYLIELMKYTKQNWCKRHSDNSTLYWMALVRWKSHLDIIVLTTTIDIGYWNSKKLFCIQCSHAIIEKCI